MNTLAIWELKCSLVLAPAALGTWIFHVWAFGYWNWLFWALGPLALPAPLFCLCGTFDFPESVEASSPSEPEKAASNKDPEDPHQTASVLLTIPTHQKKRPWGQWAHGALVPPWAQEAPGSCGPVGPKGPMGTFGPMGHDKWAWDTRYRLGECAPDWGWAFPQTGVTVGCAPGVNKDRGSHHHPCVKVALKCQGGPKCQGSSQHVRIASNMNLWGAKPSPRTP